MVFISEFSFLVGVMFCLVVFRRYIIVISDFLFIIPPVAVVFFNR